MSHIVKYSPTFIKGPVPYILPKWNYNVNKPPVHWGILFISEPGARVKVKFYGKGEVDALLGFAKKVDSGYQWDPPTVFTRILKQENKPRMSHIVEIPGGWALEPRVQTGNIHAITVRIIK